MLAAPVAADANTWEEEDAANDEALNEAFGGLDLQPPPLTHQGRKTWLNSYSSDEDEPPLYRSLALHDGDQTLPNPAVPDNDGLVVYRSVHVEDDSVQPLQQLTHETRAFVSFPEILADPTDWHCGSTSWADHWEQSPMVSRDSCNSSAALKSFSFELPLELFDAVLSCLPAYPDLFSTMQVCSVWRDAARTNYLHRLTVVPPSPDGLLRAVAAASHGDTICLKAGVHLLSAELTIDCPLRLLSEAEADARLAHWRGTKESIAARTATPATCPPAYRDSLGRVSAAAAVQSRAPPNGGAVVLVGTLHVLLRTRCTTHVAGITLCRMGDEVGYPNAVTYAEGGFLRMERCRVTCGGAATSVPQALEAFAGAPEPGVLWLPHESGAGGGDGGSSSVQTGDHGAGSAVNDVLAERQTTQGAVPCENSPTVPFVTHRERSQCPQSGVWVGAASSVELRGCTIAACMGPGVKIYRGRLHAHGNTIAFSERGANVVANGGHVTLEANEIAGANGDGVSSWNNSVMRIERNSIHGNTGAGIAINTGGGSVHISGNTVFDNRSQAVLFATSSRQQATVLDNDFEGNSLQSVSAEALAHAQVQASISSGTVS